MILPGWIGQRSTIDRDQKGPESCPTTRTGSVLLCLANRKIGTNFWRNQSRNLPSGRIPEEEGVTEIGSRPQNTYHPSSGKINWFYLVLGSGFAEQLEHKQ